MKRQHPTEAQWQMSFVEHIDAFKFPDLVYWATPNGEIRPGKTLKDGRRVSIVGRKLKLMGVKPGAPDMFFVRPGQPLFAIELKRKGGALSDAQKEMISALELCGIPVYVIDDLDDAIALLEDKGCVKPSNFWTKRGA